MKKEEKLVDDICRYEDVLRSDQCLVICFGDNSDISEYTCKFVRYLNVNIILCFPDPYYPFPGYILWLDTAKHKLRSALEPFSKYSIGVFTCPSNVVFMCRYLKPSMYFKFIIGQRSTIIALENECNTSYHTMISWMTTYIFDKYDGDNPYIPCYDGE